MMHSAINEIVPGLCANQVWVISTITALRN